LAGRIKKRKSTPLLHVKAEGQIQVTTSFVLSMESSLTGSQELGKEKEGKRGWEKRTELTREKVIGTLIREKA